MRSIRQLPRRRFKWHAKEKARMSEHGANVNATSLFGETVLQEACKLGTSESIIRLLLKNGVDVDASAGGLLYGSALQEACKSGTEDMIKLLLEYGASVNGSIGECYGSALQEACATGNECVVQFLISRGALVNASTERYGTALQEFCAIGNQDIIRLLLENGAKANVSAVNTTTRHFRNLTQLETKISSNC